MPWRSSGHSGQPAEPGSDDSLEALVEVVPAPQTPGRTLDRLDEHLLRLAGNPWRIRDAIEGTQVFGGNGSGKTSGSGRTIASSFVRHGFGGLVLTAKPDELEQWVGYMAAGGLDEAAISERLVVFQPASAPPPELRSQRGRLITPTVCTSFNFLDYEFGRTNRLTLELVSLFLDAMSPGGTAVSGSDPYWDEALRELLTHAVDLAALAALARTGTATVRLADMLEIINTAPQTKGQAASPAWRNPDTPGCWQAISLITEKLVKPRKLAPGVLADFSQCLTYWTEQFPALADRTRSIIVSSLTVKAAGLLHSPMRELLCGPDDPVVSTAAPEATFAGKIVVVNLPVKLYGEVGRFAQTLMKTVWQRAVERRISALKSDPSQHPVFLWSDEAQYFICRADARFQQTARSAVAATVFLTQNISNYYAALPGASAQHLTDSLLGNLQTKIFHSNGDPATNEWAQRLFGKTERRVRSDSVNLAGRSDSDSRGLGSAASWLPVVEASHFSALRTGGPANHLCVDAWIFKAGSHWTTTAATERALGYPEVPPHILHCTFHQEGR